MESEIITTIADKGAIGVVILAVMSILWPVLTYSQARAGRHWFSHGYMARRRAFA